MDRAAKQEDMCFVQQGETFELAGAIDGNSPGCVDGPMMQLHRHHPMWRVMGIPTIQERRDHITQLNGNCFVVPILRTCPVQEKFDALVILRWARIKQHHH